MLSVNGNRELIFKSEKSHYFYYAMFIYIYIYSFLLLYYNHNLLWYVSLEATTLNMSYTNQLIQELILQAKSPSRTALLEELIDTVYPVEWPDCP